MIYAHFESVFLAVIDVFGCVDHKFSKPFKMLFYRFTSCMIEGSKYCRHVTKKNFNKELVMTKKSNEDFENSTKCWICDNDYIDNDVKVRDHCLITGKVEVLIVISILDKKTLCVITIAMICSSLASL